MLCEAVINSDYISAFICLAHCSEVNDIMLTNLPTRSLFSETYPSGSTERLSKDWEEKKNILNQGGGFGGADIQSKLDIRGNRVFQNPIRKSLTLFMWRRSKGSALSAPFGKLSKQSFGGGTGKTGRREVVSYPASPGLGGPQPWAAVHISHKEVRNSEG